MLEDTYQSLQKCLKKTVVEAKLAIKEEESLVTKVRARTESLQHSDCGSTTIALDKELNNLHLLLNRKNATVNQLRQRVSALEGEIQKAYTQKQVYAARAASELSIRRAHYFLGNLDSDPFGKMLEEQELRIDQAEARALEISVQVSQVEVDKLDSQQLYQLLTKLDTAIRQLKQALLVLSSAGMQLRQMIETDRGKSETWREREEMAREQGNHELARQASERGRRFLESAELLAEQIPHHDRSKLRVEKLLSKLESSREKLEQNQ